MTMLLQARNIAVSRGTTELFDNLELAVSSGDRIGVVGHNGAGKSTLLQLLAGELAADKGDILRKRGLRLAVVEQFLPEQLHALSIRAAVAERVAADEAWRADALLSELGFEPSVLERAAGEFSGGQQNRLMLARALVCEPELLLLDEPTNHLDLATLLLFESLLRDFAGGLVLVSHDRDFLDAVTNTTCVLRDARAYRFAMSYTPAMQALVDMDEAHAKSRAAQERKIAALKQSAKRLATWGKVYDNEKFARRAKSMERRVERMEEDRTFVSSGSPLDLELQLGETRARQALVIEDFDVEVPGRKLYSIEEFIVRPGDRIALLGANGTGKSTLIRSIMAAYQHAQGLPGIRFSPQSVIGYYDQELDEVAGDESLLAFACARVDAAEQTVRTRLIRSGFPHGDHDKRVGQMSGGERARLLFLIHALNRPNFMILDEPTNHIDIAGKEQLEDELRSSNATLLITSHDRRFLTRLANRYLWIRDGALVEVPNAERFFHASAPAQQPANDVHTKAGDTSVRNSQSLTQSAEEVLETIVELERKLAEDEARKAKFRKPALQRRWRDELQVLYARLEALDTEQ